MSNRQQIKNQAPVEKVVSMHNITWKREGKPILQDVSWQIEQGEHWVLLGLNGSGKTSLLNMMLGYHWPSQGQVYVLGHRFGQTNLPELRKSIGWVSASLIDRYQSQFHQSVMQVIMSGKYASIGLYEGHQEADVGQAEQLVQQFGLEAVADHPLRTLSQGEKIKVMLARAWMANPELLILDEPCSGLDLKARENLMHILHSMMSRTDGPTIIYVTHHVEEIISPFTHVLLLHAGQVVASGTKENVLTEAKLRQAFELPLNIQWQHGRPWVSMGEGHSPSLAQSEYER